MVAVDAREEIRLLRATGTVVPFVETVDGDDARSLREGAAKGGLLRDGLGARVEEPTADLGVLGPARHQSPAVAVEDPLVVLLRDGEESPLGSNVPTRGRVGIEAGREGGVEESRQANWRGEEGDASTHGHQSAGKIAPLARVMKSGYLTNICSLFHPIALRCLRI